MLIIFNIISISGTDIDLGLYSPKKKKKKKCTDDQSKQVYRIFIQISIKKKKTKNYRLALNFLMYNG